MQKPETEVKKTMTDPKETSLPQPEDFWLEIGPPCSYLGLNAWDAALREGDASPDGKRRGFSGAEPGQAPADTAVLPETENSLDDVPPIDR